MIVIMGILAGATTGALIAIRRQGKPADIAQYAAASALIFGIVAMVATVLLHRLVV